MNLEEAEKLAAQASTNFYEIDNRVIADKREKKKTDGLLDEWNVKRNKWRSAESALKNLR